MEHADENLFIEKLKEMELLWNNKHQYYRNKSKRNEALQVLSKYYLKGQKEATIADVRKKINVLRTNFRAHLRRRQKSLCSGVPLDQGSKPDCWTYRSLMFLLEGDSHNQDLFSVADDSIITETMTIKTEAIFNEDVKDIILEPETSRLADETNHTNMAFNSYDKVEQIPEAIEKRNLDQLPKSLTTVCSCGGRKVPAIAIAWGEQLETLHHLQKPFAVKAINDILFAASQKTLHRSSVSINDDELSWVPQKKKKRSCT